MEFTVWSSTALQGLAVTSEDVFQTQKGNFQSLCPNTEIDSRTRLFVSALGMIRKEDRRMEAYTVC